MSKYQIKTHLYNTIHNTIETKYSILIDGDPYAEPSSGGYLSQIQYYYTIDHVIDQIEKLRTKEKNKEIIKNFTSYIYDYPEGLENLKKDILNEGR